MNGVVWFVAGGVTGIVLEGLLFCYWMSITWGRWFG
jgi:hypothetical protein